MCGLPDPMPGSEETSFDLRSHPSLAQHLVARLPDLPERTAGTRGGSSGAGVKNRPAWTADDLGHGALSGLRVVNATRAPHASEELGRLAWKENYRCGDILRIALWPGEWDGD